MCRVRWTKNKIAALAIVVALFSIAASSTMAYFTAEDTARNVITSGGLEVSVLEMQQMVDGTLQPYPDEPVQVMPGTTVSKIVAAANGEQEAWVRMAYTITIYNADGTMLNKSAEELEQAVIIETDTEHWTFAEDRWYYNTAVKSGEITEPLFKEVKFSASGMDNEYQNCTIEILVTAQAVQTANNPLPESGRHEDISGWPE